MNSSSVTVMAAADDVLAVSLLRLVQQCAQVVFGEVEAERACCGLRLARVECAGLVGVEEGEGLTDLFELILTQTRLLVGARLQAATAAAGSIAAATVQLEREKQI